MNRFVMTDKKKYSLSEIIQMDQYLMSLAAYESSKGMTALPNDMDAVLNFQNDVKIQFRNFKRMIQNQECSFEELEQMVIRRHGPVANPFSKMTMSQTLQEIANEKPEANNEEESFDDFMGYIMNSLKASLPEGVIVVGNNSLLSPQHNPKMINPPSVQDSKEIKETTAEEPQSPMKSPTKPTKKAKDGNQKRKNSKSKNNPE